jgi:hypothetical protein
LVWPVVTDQGFDRQAPSDHLRAAMARTCRRVAPGLGRARCTSHQGRDRGIDG